MVLIPIDADSRAVFAPFVITKMFLNVVRYASKWKAVVEASNIITYPSLIYRAAFLAINRFSSLCSRCLMNNGILWSGELIFRETMPLRHTTSSLFSRILISLLTVGSLMKSFYESSFTECGFCTSKLTYWFSRLYIDIFLHLIIKNQSLISLL